MGPNSGEFTLIYLIIITAIILAILVVLAAALYELKKRRGAVGRKQTSTRGMEVVVAKSTTVPVVTGKKETNMPYERHTSRREENKRSIRTMGVVAKSTAVPLGAEERLVKLPYEKHISPEEKELIASLPEYVQYEEKRLKPVLSRMALMLSPENPNQSDFTEVLIASRGVSVLISIAKRGGLKADTLRLVLECWAKLTKETSYTYVNDDDVSAALPVLFGNLYAVQRKSAHLYPLLIALIEAVPPAVAHRCMPQLVPFAEATHVWLAVADPADASFSVTFKRTLGWMRRLLIVNWSFAPITPEKTIIIELLEKSFILLTRAINRAPRLASDPELVGSLNEIVLMLTCEEDGRRLFELDCFPDDGDGRLFKGIVIIANHNLHEHPSMNKASLRALLGKVGGHTRKAAEWAATFRRRLDTLTDNSNDQRSDKDQRSEP